MLKDEKLTLALQISQNWNLNTSQVEAKPLNILWNLFLLLLQVHHQIASGIIFQAST